MVRRRIVVLAFAALPACSLLVDTDGLVPTSVPAPIAEAGSTEPDTSIAIAPSLDAGAAGSPDAHDAAPFPKSAVVWSGNGHGYEVVHSEGITWAQARIAAATRGGHLATLTSEDENTFVWALVDAFRPRVVLDWGAGPWLGGRQADGAREPDGGWGWITGEPWRYERWNGDEPNDNQSNEAALGYLNGPAWADYRDDQGVAPGYVVEYEP